MERYHHPSAKGWDSGVLEADDLTPKSRQYMLRAFELGAAPGTFWQQVGRLRQRLSSSQAYRALKKRGRTTATASAASSALP
jgi:hypothetical protein